MATKRVDSFSTFLETVDEGFRSARTKGATTPPATGLSPNGATVLARLHDAEDGAMTAEQLQADLGLGVLELGAAVRELADKELVRAIRAGSAEIVALNPPAPGA